MNSAVRTEILTTGDELLDGRVLDTNTVVLAEMLRDIGGRISQRTSVPDDLDAIVREAKAAAARGARLCVVSGGLGPTSDDVTSEAFAKLCGVNLVRDPAQVEAITARLTRLGRPISANQLKQADRPGGATVIPNLNGTAPGFAVTWGGCHFVCVPGVPAEFETMVAHDVISLFDAGATPLVRAVVCSFGLSEGEVDRRLSELVQAVPGIRVGYRAKIPEIHVSLVAEDRAPATLEKAMSFVRAQLGNHIFAERDVSLPEVVVEDLKQRGRTLALAESLTGGLLGDLITNVPGASDVLKVDVVAYSVAAKKGLLGVKAETLRRYGVVSEKTALEMAVGVRKRLKTDYALSTTGVAGPTGGTPETPVGTVCLGLVGPRVKLTRRLSFSWDRKRNKMLAAYAALELLRGQLS